MGLYNTDRHGQKLVEAMATKFSENEYKEVNDFFKHQTTGLLDIIGPNWDYIKAFKRYNKTNFDLFINFALIFILSFDITTYPSF